MPAGPVRPRLPATPVVLHRTFDEPFGHAFFAFLPVTIVAAPVLRFTHAVIVAACAAPPAPA